MMRNSLLLLSLAAAIALAGCGKKPEPVASPAAVEQAGKPKAGTLEWAAGGAWRLDTEKARDEWRHPVQTLTFFGIKPADTVVEIFPGGGWYTAILGPYLKAGGGHLIVANPDPAASAATKANDDAYEAAFADHPEIYGDIKITVASKDAPGIAPDGSVDAVVTFRNVHNWMAGGYADKIFADAFRALKPGGVLGVEEHRLPSTRDQDMRASTGYVQESYVIQLATHAGFEHVDSSEINANPKDNADHPLGVWMLPPNLRAPAPGTPEAATYDAAKYKAIGESDRMTLLFRKPASPAVTPPPATP
jgi:predicted methyltransferase